MSDVVGRLLSLNVGVPREVSWQGKTVRSAIWKDPVDGPRMVRTINIDGDDQADRAGHGGEHRAVFVYQIESYRYWEEQLGRDDFVHGQFGENFTVQGLADDEVCIGDRYRIGEALFEVTQPRVTCFRLGIRMDEHAMPSLLVSHRRPGFYFRVLEEGLVESGQEIVRVASGPEALTVADIDGLLYLPNRSHRMLERAVRIPALSEGWKGSFRDLLAPASAPPPPPAWEGFAPMTVTAVMRESSTIASFTLHGPSDGTQPVAEPGQYLTLRLRPDGPDAPAVIRSYSLSSVPSEESFRISVKHEPGGVGSGFMHEQVSVGDTIDVAAPRGSFVLRDGERPIVLVSAGVGATPVLAMLHALAAQGAEREVWWLHGARNGQEQAFAREVDTLLADLPRAHRIVAYSRPDPGDTSDIIGRLSSETLADKGIPLDATYYVCGPDAFMRSISAGLTARGVQPERVATETFGAVDTNAPGIVGTRPAPHQPDGARGTGPAVTFSRSNLTVTWDSRYGSLLDLADASDVPTSYGCRTGVCHYCETGLLSGEVRYVTEPLEPAGEGRVLLCCSEPDSELTLDL